MKNYDDYYASQNEHILNGGEKIFQRQLNGLEGKSVVIDKSTIPYKVLIQKFFNNFEENKYELKLTCNLLDPITTGTYITYINESGVAENYIATTFPDVNHLSRQIRVDRCNGSLKWYDKGILYDYRAVFNRGGYYDLKKDGMVFLPDNQIRAIVQYNEDTNKIKWADIDDADIKFTRFILEGEAYRVVSIDKMSLTLDGVGCLDLRLQADVLCAGDDLINNIADANVSVVVQILNGSTLSLGEGQTVQINSEVTLDDNVLVNPTIKYTSSNPLIATVDSNGLVATLDNGLVTITASYSTATDSIDITVTEVVTDNYTVDIVSSTGIIDGIKLGQKVSYSSTSKNNGSPYTIVGTWSVLKDDGITPMDSSIISVISNVGNTLSIKCASSSANVGKYFKVKYEDANASEIIRIRINNLF